MPDALVTRLLREHASLDRNQPVRSAAADIVAAGLPALPVTDGDGRLHGIFGEREFVQALFPGYLAEMPYAGFIRQSLDDTIKQRSSCLAEPVGRYANREEIAVHEDASSMQVAATFIHHRVLIVPVVTHARQVRGLITRSDFFTELVARTNGAT